MRETWRVIDEAGVRHEVAVDARRGSPPSWWAKRADGMTRRSPYGARDALLQLAYACGWGIVEALAPGERSREEMEAEIAHLEARGGALLAEVERLRAFLPAETVASCPACGVDITADLVDGAYVTRQHSRRAPRTVGLGDIVRCDGGVVRTVAR